MKMLSLRYPISAVGLMLAIVFSTTMIVTADAAKRFESNAIHKINPAKLKAGENLIDRNSLGFSLYCIAAKGQKLKFVVKDPNGKVLPTTFSKTATTCWECGKDAAGNTHCWKIPCPVIVGPWTPGKLKAIQ